MPSRLAAQPESKVSRTSTLTQTLRQSIVSGDLRPGAKLSLDRLRTIHHVSLSPLREAITRLVPMGLVEIYDQRGFRVAPVSLAGLHEVVLLRNALDPLAVSATMAHADLEWESRILGAHHMIIRAAKGDRVAALRLFHHGLTAGCGMPFMTELCGALFDQMARYGNLFPPAADAERAMDKTRDLIVQAAVARDTATATTLLRDLTNIHSHAIETAMAHAKPDNNETGMQT